MERLQQIQDLRRALDDLREYGTTFKKTLDAFKDLIDTEKFASADFMTNMGDSFVDWMKKTKTCFISYEKLFKTQPPETFAEIENILDAEEIKIRETDIFFQAEKFLHIVATSSDLQKNLDEHQKRLVKLLERKRQGAKFKATLEIFAKFVKAINEVDFGKKFSASKELNNFFDDEFIGRGLFGGELTLTADDDVKTSRVKKSAAATEAPAQSVTETDVVDADKSTSTTDDVKTSRRKKSAAATEAPAQSVTETDVADADKSTSTTDDVKTSRKKKVAAATEAPAQSSTETELAEILETTGALLTETDLAQWETSFRPDEKDVVKKPSAKRLKNEFDRNSVAAVHSVLSYIMSNGFLCPPTFCPKNMTLDMLEKTAQLLFSRGYIRKYMFGDVCSFYGFAKCFMDSAKELADKKIFKSKRDDKNTIGNRFFFTDQAKYALVIAIYLYFCNIESAQKISADKAVFFAQSFYVEYSNDDERDLFIGCLWDTTDECDKFLKSLLKSLKTGTKFNRVFVAGLKLEQAAKIFDALEKVLADDMPKDAAHYIYAFNDEAFYRRDTHEKISAEEIWQSPNPDPDPENSSDDDADDDVADGSESSDESADDVANVSDIQPTDAAQGKILSVVRDMILAKKFYCATAYLKAQSLKSSEVEPLYRQLAFALDDPLLHENYNSAAIVSLPSGQDAPFNEALIIAAAVRALFYNDYDFAHGLEDMCDLVNGFELVKANDALSNLIRDLKAFKEKTNTGVKFYADNHTDDTNPEETFAKIVRDAQEYYQQRLEGYTPEANHGAFVVMWQDIFARNGELANLFRLMIDDSTPKSPDVISRLKNYLLENFLQNDADIDDKNFDAKKFAAFVDGKWKDAHIKKYPHQKVDKFKGEYRNNIESNLRRAFKIMCDWINCAQTFGNGSDDWGGREYKKILPQLSANAQTACQKLNRRVKAKSIESAGISVVIKTLEELCRRLNGTYNEIEREYFYVEFLCGDYVIADENCLPNFNLNITDGINENIPAQIEKHSKQKKFPTVAERLEFIFSKDGSANYGAAQILDNYLYQTEKWSFIAKNVSDFESSVKAAGHEAREQWQEFSGGLVFAQIQGQLESLPEYTKEEISQIIDSCYEYAERSKNYGVFFRVKKFWEDTISRNADELTEKFSDELQRVVEDFKQTVADFDAAELQESIADIEKFISSKMFTKAESCIRILRNGKIYKKSVSDGNHTLSKFFEDYNELYRQVRDTGRPLDKLLERLTDSRRTHNKDTKNRAELINNWLPGGIPRGEERFMERVKNLLMLLAFDVDSIELLDKDNDAITYKVKLKKSFRISHTHPIANFGSNAESDTGFHVACLFGKYDEQSLLDRFKKLDNGDTIVLLDFPLMPQVRHELDKVLKHDKSLMHVFAVVDRVVIMYLIKNCYEQIKKKDINDTLMSLIMPFSKCVPYVSDSKRYLPPEMFIGREKAMIDVKAPNGVNIIYGGRQLGKSALLKKARQELDGNDNQRAILVVLWKEDYRQAALHVSRELIDQKFFDSTFTETDDWDVLTRAIRNRLLSDEPTKIPYFLLMLDEADKFIETCAEVQYRPMQVLSDLQQTNYNGSHFKFIIAGVHNIVRYDKSQVERDNNILPLLKSFTIKPFTAEEARKLLEVPLGYLGIHFHDDKFIYMIEETALYYPGLIQYFCEKLLTMLFDLRNYDNDTPPYVIRETDIKRLLADKEFLDAVKERINITLQLGDDRYYYVIAQLLAYLYHTKNPVTAFTPRDILMCAKDDFVELIKDKFLPNDESKIDALMTELCELNILCKNPNAAKYSFSNRSILQYMGTEDDIFDKLVDLIAEADNG